MKHIAFMSVLDLWVESNFITLFDKHFAKQMFQVESNPDDFYLALCVFCSNSLSHQQTCLLLDHIAVDYCFIEPYFELKDL